MLTVRLGLPIGRITFFAFRQRATFHTAWVISGPSNRPEYAFRSAMRLANGARPNTLERRVSPAAATATGKRARRYKARFLDVVPVKLCKPPQKPDVSSRHVGLLTPLVTPTGLHSVFGDLISRLVWPSIVPPRCLPTCMRHWMPWLSRSLEALCARCEGRSRLTRKGHAKKSSPFQTSVTYRATLRQSRSGRLA
jgi:hypothetical protein